MILSNAEDRIKAHLRKSREEGLVKHSPKHYLRQLTITEDYNLLKDCNLVIECTLEDMDIKKSVYEKIERVINSDAC